MKKVNVKLSQKKYDIIVEKNILNNIGSEVRKLYSGDKIAIVTDKNVDEIYGEKVVSSLTSEGYKVIKIVVMPGEKSKSIEELLHLYSELLAGNLNRGNIIIALGGGVVGDLTGFAASTLLRGIPYIQIPTTLLAQVDSSIGGKVAVDLPQGKNLVGSFYHPEVVFIDSEVLRTLPERYLNDGMAEVIKYGAIRNRELFQKLMNIESKEELFENIDNIIYTCCSIKRDIVQRDEKDNGERMLLNFGHTIGHAIEKHFNFEVYSHGEAIAIGMYAITRKSEELGITEKGSAEALFNILNKYKLPSSFPGQKDSTRDIIGTLGKDKKNKGSKINILLLKSIGDGFILNMPLESVEDYIRLDY